MRIAIDYRLLSGGSNVLHRGTGRYTQQQLRAVLQYDAENEYLLVCHADADETLILPEIRRAPNASLARLSLPGLKREAAPNQPAKALRHVAQFQDWLYQQKVDLYHETTPYQIDELVLTHFDVCPLVATLYDLIPMVYPDHYWPFGAPFHEELNSALQLMANANRLIAISESARHDAYYYLGMPEERMHLAYPVADPFFRPMPPSEVAQVLTNLRARFPIPDSFVMSLTHIHHSKNLDALLTAYARLPRALRQQFPLVVVFFLQKSDRGFLEQRLAALEITENVILTGLVSDNELVALYNAAMMLVHPSRYEGFGYPVVEAMQCGTPVITTTASSLPEVGGQAVIAIDPDDLSGFTDAMQEVLGNPVRRQQMRESGFEQVKRFNLEQLGRATQACYQQALTTPTDDRPRLALWSSLPPLKCGIADYTTELLPELTPLYQIELFVDDGYVPSPEMMRRYTIHHHSAFMRRMAQRPFDANLYQLGISFMHDYMYEPLQQCPGVVVMHDLNFAANLHYVYAGRQRLDVFEKQFVSPEGAEAVQAYQRTRRLKGAEQERALGQFFQNYPLNKWVVDHSLAQIVHLEESKRILEARCPHARAFAVPMGLKEPWSDLTARLKPVRDTLLEEADTFLVGVFGTVDPIKRVDISLHAFTHLLKRWPNSQLVVVGELVDSVYAQRLQALVKSLGIADQVTFTGRVVLDVLHQWLLACDAVLNLRYPPKLQMSAVLGRAIAAGKPVIITDLPEWRSFPDDFCWRVAPDENEIETITNYLCRLASDPALRQQRAEQARQYYERHGTVSQMARNYQTVIEAVTAKRPTSQRAVSSPSSEKLLSLNKACDIEDFDALELKTIMREVFEHESHYHSSDFPRGAERREYWESAMTVRALRQAQALHADAMVLSLEAGAHPLNYYFTRHAAQVWMIDRYLHQGPSGCAILAGPQNFAPYACRPERLVVQAMDSRLLRYADNTFDAVFACRPIRHVGGLDSIAHMAYEAGRVLKPSGVASFIVEFILSGPLGQIGWNADRPLLSLPLIERYLVEASGLELMVPWHPSPSPATIALPRHLTLRPAEYERAETRPAQLVYTVGGYVVGALHVALRKGANYPVQSNDWAKPTPQIQALIRQETTSTTRGLATWGETKTEVSMPPASAMPLASPAFGLQLLRQVLSEPTLIQIKNLYNRMLDRMPKQMAGMLHQIFRKAGLIENGSRE